MSVDGTAGPSGGCPHLGLDGDPSTRCLFATPEHRCHRSGSPASISAERQMEVCLSGSYQDCSLEGAGAGLPVAGIVDAVTQRRKGVGKRDLMLLRTALLTIVFLGVSLGILAMFIFSAPVSGSGTGAVAGGTPAPVVDVGTPGAEVVSVAPVASPTPSTGSSGAAAGGSLAASGTATAVARAEASPTSEPSGKVYVVQAGDTLWSVATSHGVTVDEMMAANGLENQNFIWSGQKLVIPEPGQTP